MRKGACIIASNVTTEDKILFDYIGLAQKNAQSIRTHLNLPVALLTTSTEQIEGFDEVVRLPSTNIGNRIINHNNRVIVFPWDNDHRIDALEFTPYDRTLLVDADYLIRSSHLRPLLQSDSAFLIADNAVDVTGRNSFNGMKLMPDKTFSQRWATFMVFDKNAQHVFDAAAMVKKNYRYYATMFNFSSSLFRNDFVFSIAAHLLGIPKCPVKLFQSPVDTIIESADKNGFRLKYNDHIMRWNYDLHVLNKDIVIESKILETANV